MAPTKEIRVTEFQIPGKEIEWPPGSGRKAHYLPHEQEIMRAVARSGAPTAVAEVDVLHALKVEFPGGGFLSDADAEALGPCPTLDEQMEAAQKLEAQQKLATEGAGLYAGLAEEAHARSTDPATSHAAAGSISSDELRHSQRAVLECIRQIGSGCDEDIQIAYEDGWKNGMDWPQQSVSGLRTRRKELVDAGLVRDSGRRMTLDTGRQTTVWEIAPADGQGSLL